jgi:hypothetical protein
MKGYRFSGIVRLLSVMLLVSWCAYGGGQEPGDALGSLPTQERVQQPGWWPTKPLSPHEQKQVAGRKACGTCHTSIAASQEQTAMAHAVMPVASSDVLRAHAHDRFSLGRFAYQLEHSSEITNLSVASEGESKSTELQWAFGSGQIGQSYAWQVNGVLFESRFNYFRSLDGFDATPGHAGPDSLSNALGRGLSAAEASGCFSCHASGLTLEKPLGLRGVTLGISCEACHGPGAEHIAAVASKHPEAGLRILNPLKLDPWAQVDFCGACHGTSWDVRIQGFSGVATVRFPAFRLQQSRCWGNGDARLTCIACHDPHQPLVHDAAFYDQKCLACHRSSGSSSSAVSRMDKSCPVATNQCTGCHMPKYEVPEMHFRFTDHRIRVTHAAAGFDE